MKKEMHLCSLIHEKERFNKDLKIYFCNLELDELPNELNSTNMSFLNSNTINLYAQHYSKLADHCPFVYHIDYNVLEECFNKIPENFMDRFVNFFLFEGS